MESLKEPMPQFHRLATEYGEWYQDMRKGKNHTLNFQSWIARHRALANEEFEHLRRVAVAKGWTACQFLGEANQLMALKGHYFGDFGKAPDYQALVRASDLTMAPPPWAPLGKPDPGGDAKEPTGRRTSSLRNGGKAPAAVPSLVKNSCEHCGEDQGDGAWSRGLPVVVDGTRTRPTRVCRAEGCATVLDWAAIEQYRRQGEKGFECLACRNTLCAHCGAPQPSAVRRYARRAYHAVASLVVPTQGLAPFRRAAHRQGFKERTLDDVHIPISLQELKKAGFLSDGPGDGHEAAAAADADDDRLLSAGPQDAAKKREGRAGAPLDESEYNLAHVLRSKRERQAARGGLARRIDFGPVHQEQPTDAWFAQRNRDVYAATARFAERWFGDVDFPADFEGAAWLEDYGVQFAEYAGRVACEDRVKGTWEVMMRDKEHRKWLVMAVLADIMHRKIFTELLFGATRDQAAELDKQDAMFVDADGYQRSRLRSEMINMYLQGRLLSDDFWYRVDGLASATTAVLLPLVNVLCYFRRPEQWTDAGELWSELHGLLAQAGYLAVCMARSPAVFHVLAATPGARMDWTLERQADHGLYAASRDEVRRLEAAREARARAERDLAVAEGAPDEAADAEREYRLALHHHTAGAKVKYAVWPGVTLYRQENAGVRVVGGGGGNGGGGRRPDERELERGEGQRVVDIGKCVVIYYQGLLYPRALAPGFTERDGVPLAAHRANERRVLELRWRERWQVPQFVVMLALTGAAFHHLRPFGRFVRAQAPPPGRVAAACAAGRAHAGLALAAAAVLALLLRRRRDYLLGQSAPAWLAALALYGALARAFVLPAHRAEQPYALAALAFVTAVALLHGRARPYVFGFHAKAVQATLSVAAAVFFFSFFLH